MPGHKSRTLCWALGAALCLWLAVTAGGQAVWGDAGNTPPVAPDQPAAKPAPSADKTNAPARAARPPKEDEDVRLGRRAAAALEREYRLVKDPNQLARLKRIGEEVAAVSDEPAYRYTFKVLDLDDVNALSLPGGFIYTTKGMLSYLRSDHELAAVLAHEIAHAAKHHVRDLQRREATANQYVILGVLAALLLGRMHTEGLGNMLFGAEVVKIAYLNQYGQEAETEADRTGVEYLIQTGKYNPVGMLTVLERLARDEERQAGPPLGVFRTHPPGRERVQALEAFLRTRNIPINRRAVQDQLHARAVEVTAGGQQAAEVRLGDTVVFRTAAGLPAATRIAEELTRWILDGAEARDVRVAADGVTVTLAGHPVYTISPEDAALDGRPAAEVARESVRRIASVLWRAFVEQVF